MHCLVCAVVFTHGKRHAADGFNESRCIGAASLRFRALHGGSRPLPFPLSQQSLLATVWIVEILMTTVLDDKANCVASTSRQALVS